jgi:lipoprotein NlpD
MQKREIFLLPCIFCFILIGCGVKFGVYHTVNKGETLWRIARAYGVELQEVAEINNLQDPTKIKVSQKVFIPGVARVLKVTPYISDGGNIGRRKEIVILDKGRFIWPLRGKVVSQFGIRNATKHNGIDIASYKNAEIKAAADGKAVYSSNDMKGYGNMVILKHKDNFFTIYAYNSKNLVKKGDIVKKGKVIALVGRTGNASDYNLHFEIRSGKRSRNPLFFLP